MGKWRSRFIAEGLDGLTDEPRPGRPPTISIERVEDVVAATLESVPRNATHWSRVTMAERTGLSKSTIGRIWRSFELKPHRTDGLTLPNDPLFAEKVHDVVGLYPHPPESAVPADVADDAGHARAVHHLITSTAPGLRQLPHPQEPDENRPDTPPRPTPPGSTRTSGSSPTSPPT